MDAKEKIAIIEKERYGNYQGRLMKGIGKLHNHLRYMEKPLTFWQFIKSTLGFKVVGERIMTDEKFLEFLEQCEKDNPRPVFKLPDNLFQHQEKNKAVNNPDDLKNVDLGGGRK